MKTDLISMQYAQDVSFQ